MDGALADAKAAEILGVQPTAGMRPMVRRDSVLPLARHWGCRRLPRRWGMGGRGSAVSLRQTLTRRRYRAIVWPMLVRPSCLHVPRALIASLAQFAGPRWWLTFRGVF